MIKRTVTRAAAAMGADTTMPCQERILVLEKTKEVDMIEAQTFRHRNYELTCSAQASDNGRFEPGLVVSKHVWPSRPRTIAVRRGAHPSVECAIESARAQGVEWVTNFG